MELAFETENITCLDTALCQTQTVELSQELRLGDGMPDVKRIVGCWGQGIIRGKEWRTTSVQISGGVMVWVVYGDENGNLQTIPGWLPMQAGFTLPPDTPEGVFQVQMQPRFFDARSVSPRKINLRVGLSILGNAMYFTRISLSKPAGKCEGAELLRCAYPIRLIKEAGEKTVNLEDEIGLNTSGARELLYACLCPEITECRVIGDKLAVRGKGNLHMLLQGERGVASEDFPLEFSQFAELEDTYSDEAEGRLIPAVTALETELTDGVIRLRWSLCMQYGVTDTDTIELVEDAYAPGRTMELETQQQYIPGIIEEKTLSVSTQNAVSCPRDTVVDINVQPDFARRAPGEEAWQLPMQAQILYRDDDGGLQAVQTRWEQSIPGLLSEDCTWMTLPQHPQAVQLMPGASQPELRCNVPVEMIISGGSPVPMVTAAKIGEEYTQGAVSLMIRRAGTMRLWDLAKSCGSTVEAIKSLNHLEGEPAPTQLLLIPVSA